MEVKWDNPITCMDLGENRTIVVGAIDGSLSLSTYDENSDLQLAWEFKLKSSVRDAKFAGAPGELYAITRSKALCSFDIETGKRTRCLLNATTDKPNKLFVFPSIAARRHQFCIGDEEGEIKTFDFRIKDAVVCTWKEQEENINALAMDEKYNLLSASSDGTLAAFDSRKCKLRMKSELMHSELLSSATTSKYVYVGSRDGHIEVFTMGDYGNLLERIESGFDMGVDSIVQLRPGLLLTSSETSADLRLLNVMPTKRLGVFGTHGTENDGIDGLIISPDNEDLVSYCAMNGTFKIWSLPKLLDDIPIYTASTISKRKAIKKEGFFDDMMVNKNKKAKISRKEEDDEAEDDSDEDSDENDNDSDDDDSDENDSDQDDDDDDNDEEEEESEGEGDDDDEDDDGDDSEGNSVEQEVGGDASSDNEEVNDDTDDDDDLNDYDSEESSSDDDQCSQNRLSPSAYGDYPMH